MATRRLAALGLTVRTGRAVVVAVGGPIAAPEVWGKTRIDVATTFEEGAVYHVAQTLPTVEEARDRVAAAEALFTDRAQDGLRAFVKTVGAQISGARLVAQPEKKLPRLENILKVHPLCHAAEGELYRRVFTVATASLCARPARVAPEALVGQTAAVTDLTATQVTAQVAAMGKAAGKPWTADQKQAALAAWLALAAPDRRNRGTEDG